MISDLPILVSGDLLACFEPQEEIWRGETGNVFTLSSVIDQCPDFVAPLNGLAGFDIKSARNSGYSRTIFRLPLRTKPSSLSDNVYSTKKLQELLSALRKEAKYLLLFLKSVCKIEVVHISKIGNHTTFFRVEIAPPSLPLIASKRDCFMQELKNAHSLKPYHIYNVISFTAMFSVVVKDSNCLSNQSGTSTWLLTNCVGSADPTVLTAAAKQHTFPQVGMALEIGVSSDGGRLFCFLPMPVEAASGLPVHVHGTFGLNDERRTLKWPGIERRNDPTANWNKILVCKLLPPCYTMLLKEVRKCEQISCEQFYSAWPDVRVVQSTQFCDILCPLFESLFQQAVVATKTDTHPLVKNWIPLSQATFMSNDSIIPGIVKKILSDCDVKLVTVPERVWRAIHYAKVCVTKISPRLVRSKLCSFPASYSGINPTDKKAILLYCLSDKDYNDLSGFNLLPLVSGDFINFNASRHHNVVYLCSNECPRSLLLNSDHLIVDVSDNVHLQQSLREVADTQNTKLRLLTESDVARLISKFFHYNSSQVQMPHSQIPSRWLFTFWTWLQEKNLKLFSGLLIVPCCHDEAFSSTGKFHLAPLSSTQPFVYVGTVTSCSSHLLSALYKMNVRVCLQSEFKYVKHKELFSHIKELTVNNVLDTIYSQSNYTSITFSIEEANSMKKFLQSSMSSSYSHSQQRLNVLQSISIFSTSSNSSEKLYSVNTARSISVTKQVMVEPDKCCFDVKNLPSGLIMFSRGNYHQVKLLQCLNIPFVSDVSLLTKFVFPLIRNHCVSGELIDKLMPEVLDSFQIIYKDREFVNELKTLAFVKTSNGRKRPSELYTTINSDILALYEREDVFPRAPYNTRERLFTLQTCGLHTTVSAQQILNIVDSISCCYSPCPLQVDSVKLSRAKAVLRYIGKSNFNQKAGGCYLPAYGPTQNLSFEIVLKYLSTNKNWLPIENKEPQSYPQEIKWKGQAFNSHFVSLPNSVVVPLSKASTLPFLLGSQVCLVSPAVADCVASILPSDSGILSKYVAAHYKYVLQSSSLLSVKVVNLFAFKVYEYMNNDGSAHLASLYDIPDWIYIEKEKTCMSPAVVALNQNSTFKRNLEPYIYVLPDTLSLFTTLFGPASGVSETISQAQILSILKMISDDINYNRPRTTAEENWSMVMNILNWLTNNGNQRVPDSIKLEDVLIPVETQLEWPQLVQASTVVYTDNGFLKEYLQTSEDKGMYQFVHDDISTKLAHNLGVVPLSEFLDISEDTFEDAGQHEPLTTRLKNILREYKDGLTIIKELLQNADDANAAEVNICYDERHHETNPNKLFFSGMAEAHGPALVVHNDKTFSDDDFKNITKLAAETKKTQALKIGKFGIGFCSVYHMTDVPSFVSREHMYIFDPTLSYLKKEVKNPAQPGKKIKFTNRFISGSKQLDPYVGLFGFDGKQNYPGTLFRLPFRSNASELSGTCYTHKTVDELLLAIKQSSFNLLLFLRNVKKITFQHIGPSQSTPVVLLKICLESISLPIHLQPGVTIRKLSYEGPQVECTTCDWLVSEVDVHAAQNHCYSASAACPLGTFGSYAVNGCFSGELFCFLPLSQMTGLPVHINGNFAVMSNRQGIWTSDDASSQQNKEVAWNNYLITCVVPKAYHALLMMIKAMAVHNIIYSYCFYSLWPQSEKLLYQNPWKQMLPQLYSLISSDQLFYSEYRKQWLHQHESKFIAPGILCQLSEQSSTPKCVVEVVQHLNQPIVDLPITLHSYFNLKKVTINEYDFVRLFFQNLTSLKCILRTRSEIIQCMLEVYATEYDDSTKRSYMLHDFLVKSACIPCTPDGMILRKCTAVVDPNASFSSLFDESESYFPIKMLSDRHLCNASLIELGMISETIPYEILVERAQSVLPIYSINKAKALKRAKQILSSTKVYTAELELPLTRGNKTTNKSLSRQRAVYRELASVPFLPVLPKPSGYIFPWKGDGQELMCGKDLFVVGRDRYRESTAVNTILAGSQIAFVNEAHVENGGCGYINQDTLSMMCIQKSPSINNAVAQLSTVQQVFETSLPSPSEYLVESVDRICCQVYRFLDNTLKASLPQKEVQHLQISSVWDGKQFVDTSVLAIDWSDSGPYLYKTPGSISSYTFLLQSLQLKKRFGLKDIDDALKSMKRYFKYEPIDEECQSVFYSIVGLLQKLDLTATPNLMLPDENFILHQSNTLACNEADWVPKDSKYTYVHNSVPPSLAKKLGVKPTISKVLENFLASSTNQFKSIEFGQREELTRRIQNILRDYPFDITILKELLQNADDAKATKMYIILDMRTHGNQGILSQNWKKLQGPALLVWNNSVFSEKDLCGIQELGLGSKRSDYESIGQYGIGFNVVYHLTDCPSFISGGETLCVLDPHCEYVHEANALFPGRRYEGLNANFWEQFPDMSSAYLQSGLENSPPELSGGTLFRFPLRYTTEHLIDSKIVLRNTENVPLHDPTTPLSMLQKLQEWAPSMKEAMLFLNSITELNFMVIKEEGKTIYTMNKYWTTFNESGKKGRIELCKAISDFNKKKRNTSIIVRYPLSVYESYSSGGKYVSIEDKWLVQQGVGDIQNEQQTWRYIDTVKPRHGIASPILLSPSHKHSSSHHSAISRSTTVDGNKFRGKVFCFLPLPLKSKLPVHINGNFILNSTRRNLWSSSDEGREDDRSIWNNQLFQAISSSYAVLLEHAQSFYINTTPGSYKTIRTAWNDIEKYYEIFPPTIGLDKMFKVLAEAVYTNLVTCNKNILAEVAEMFINDQSRVQLQVIWHPCKSSELSEQVYFWCSSGTSDKEKEVKKILKSIGLKITEANCFVRDSLNHTIEEGNTIDIISPKTVQAYYSNFCYQVSSNGHFPCEISDTVFRTVSTFRLFSEYLLQIITPTTSDPISPSSTSSNQLKFPNEPFGTPLLLTADSQLRKFEQNPQVINSEFSGLFYNCQDFFLHPEMVNILYSSEYFVSVSDDINNYDLVNTILSHHLPNCLKSKRLLSFPSMVSKNDLVDYWRCFLKDHIFSSSLSDLLNDWALLPSTDCSLHSYLDTLVPIVPISQQQKSDELLMYQVLQEAGMPILDTEIVGTDELNLKCPVVSEVCSILKALFHLNQERDLCTIIGRNIEAIVSFIKMIDFRNDEYHNSLYHAKSLPLFECIDGTFKPLQGKEVYVWPCSASTDGFSLWNKCVPNTIFLSENGIWTSLGNPETLGIKMLSPEELYSKFIFKLFHVLNEKDRYHHLTHIRESLFDIVVACASRSGKSEHINRRRQLAITFLNDLKMLSCIGENVLKPVSSYCNHELEIFKVFSEYYLFLPDFFKQSLQWSNWLEFFKHLGLKYKATQKEFLVFCNDVSHGKQKDPVNACTVLLHTLLSNDAREAKWYENPIFLESISKISFVPIVPLHDLVWINGGQGGSQNIIVEGKQYSLAKPSEAATSDCAILLWTVKPIIQFPAHFMPHCIEEHTLLAQQLGITYKACTSDVIKNMRNICSGNRFTNIQHFDQYPGSNKPPDTSKSVQSVMVQHIEFLAWNHSIERLSDDMIRLLGHTSFIPVYSTYKVTHHWQVILVEPCQVLRQGVPNVYHPFLHNLDSKMSTYTNLLLQDVGVDSSIGLHHIQLVLQLAFKRSSGQQLEPKTRECVIAALKQLYELLSHSVIRTGCDDKKVSEILSPLYLPNRDEKLALSTTLLYVDNDNYKGQLHPKLDNTPYSLLQIRKPQNGTFIYENDFCQFLPKTVRPKGISTLCSQTVLHKCVVTEHSDVGSALEETFALIPNLPNAIAACIHRFANMSTLVESTAVIVSEFLTKLEIKTFKHLRIAISFKETEPAQELGNLDPSFFLDIAEGRFNGSLLLNSAFPLKSSLFKKMIKTLAKKLVCIRVKVPKSMPSDAYETMLSVLCELLCVQNSGDIREILDNHSISIAGEEMDKATFEIGKKVPECWHHRLDQTVENVFHPGEVVGYEMMENYVVFAQIMHPILLGGHKTFDSIPRVNMKYMILTQIEDEEGTEVGVLQLFKFLTRLKEIPNRTEDEDQLTLYEGESETVHLQQVLRNENVRQIICDLERQLIDIWKLPEEDRKRAIRRICLKWHPDKNLDKPALTEEVFKFLTSEISKRNAESDIDWTNLGRTAQRQRDTYRQEAEPQPRSSRFGSASWDGGSSAGFPKFEHENLRPDINPAEGRRWLKQAEANFKSLVVLFTGAVHDTRVCGDVCFMAHQVAEKALKGGKYFVCGLSDNSMKSHNISTHAYGLQSECPGDTHGLINHTTPLENYYLDPRYPNRWNSGIVPSDMYDYEQAKQAKEHAEAILTIIKNIVK